MSITDRIIEAILNDDNTLIITLDDFKSSSIQEVLLYYAYTKIMDIGFCFDFRDIPKTHNYGEINFHENHDIMIVLYMLNMGGRFATSVVSPEAAKEIIKYSIVYGIESTRGIRDLIHLLRIDDNEIRERKKHFVLKFHCSSQVKSARSADNPS